ncbi:hypothetical protein P3S68_004258 [Capsicum galapagoense]
MNQTMEITGVTAAAKSFVRSVYSHPEIFGHFQQVMKGYSTKELDVHAVVSELDTLFQFHHDLLIGYRIFLPPEFRVSLPMLQPRQFRKSNLIDIDTMIILKPCIDFMNKVQKRFDDERSVIEAYLKTIRTLTQGKLSNKDVNIAIAKIFGNENQDLVDMFKLVLLGDKAGRKRIRKEKNTEAEGKSKKEEKNNLSSQSDSNSDDQIKARKKKTLDDLKLGKQMEDEMFEVDVPLSRVRSIVKSAKDLKDSAKKQQHQVIDIDNHFSALSLSCIRKEYKEQGSVVIQQLRENPRHVLPQILEKFEGKEKELVNDREKVHKYWREFHEKQSSLTNHH